MDRDIVRTLTGVFVQWPLERLLEGYSKALQYGVLCHRSMFSDRKKG